MEVRRYIEYMSLSPVGVIQSFLFGLVVGFLLHIASLGLAQFVFEPLLCRSADTQFCSSAPLYAYVASVLIVHFVGLLALVKVGIIRPLLIVIASIFTLWGSFAWLGGLAWWLGALYSALLVGLSYLYFTWINRMTEFPVALGLTIVSVIVARVLLYVW